MTTATTDAESATYDNRGQYTRAGILRYEKIFGAGYVSTGGPETTAYLCGLLGPALRPGARVLDVGCGIGGAAFHLARDHGARVVGIDLAPRMIELAEERARSAGVDGVSFLLGDVMTLPRGDGFDVIWSRDALMHLHDKPALFAKLLDLCRPGGTVVITDYARGLGEGSDEFRAYVASTGYHLVDPASYGRLLEGAGFADVVVEDATPRFVDILGREPARLSADSADFLASFGRDDLDYLVDRWAMKVRFCHAGDMKWGIFRATRPA